MNTEYYIAKQILPHKNKANISKPIVTIAIIAIALGLAVMIVAISVIIGFKSTISDKIFGFSSHIQIVNFDTNTSFESIPITKDSILFENLKNEPTIKNIQIFATKPGIIKVNNSVKGVVVKGIDASYNWDFFKKHIVKGEAFNIPDTTTDRVLLSKNIALLLQLDVGDSFITTFVPNESGKIPRKRRFIVNGIYETHLNEIDDRFIIADIRHIQELNNWEPNQITGYEVLCKNYTEIDQQKEAIQDIVGYDISPNSQKFKVQSLKETTPQIFDWLSLLDMNAWVIIFLMLLVAGMNMITGLLVIILEKSNTIGVLKAIGATNVSVQKIFLYVGGILITKGLLWGNVIGIILCYVQMQFQLIPLDPNTYFMSYVPIKFDVIGLIALNLGTLVITFGMLLFPALIITKISPSSAIRFN